MLHYETRNAHSNHRILVKHVGDDTISADVDVFPGMRREVRWRFGRGPVASCCDEESVRAAFRLLSGGAET